MPLRNLLIIAIAGIVCVVCYSASARNRYANIFAEALDVVESRALQSVSRDQLFDAAMDGMISQLDRHSRYLHDDDLDRFQTGIDQQFGGLGVFIGMEDAPQKIYVRAAFPGSPADRAGLEPGDTIAAIDGVPVADMKPGERIKRMKGKVAEPVTLTIVRNEKSLDVTMIREIIDVPAVRGDRWMPEGTWKFTVSDAPNIGYIRIVSFGRETAGEFQTAISEVANTIDGVVIDLRGNSGGLLDCVVEMCDVLLPAGLTIVNIKTRDRRIIEESYKSTAAPLLAPTVPIVVLIDRYSASASEIMAGCLQDHGRAVVIGEQSWGKGTVQDVLPIERGESALKLTTASYWRPSGGNIDRDFAQANGDEQWGVQPDEGFMIPLEQIEVERNEYYRSERELRKLTGGMEFPKAFSKPKILEEASETIEGDATQQPTIPAKEKAEPASTNESLMPDAVLDAENYQDKPFERAIEHLNSVQRNSMPNAA